MRTKNIQIEEMAYRSRYTESRLDSDDEALRLKRERVNQAVECFGEDLIKIQEYLNRRSVA